MPRGIKVLIWVLCIGLFGFVMVQPEMDFSVGDV
jgi:hypothetical protein